MQPLAPQVDKTGQAQAGQGIEDKEAFRSVPLPAAGDATWGIKRRLHGLPASSGDTWCTDRCMYSLGVSPERSYCEGEQEPSFEGETSAKTHL
jgi:hypothetical protein